MSKFIKRHEDIAQARCQARRAARAGSSVGFTEAELEAAQWARKLPEVQMQISRRTNGDLRRPKGIVAQSRPKPPSVALEDEFLAELLEANQHEERELKKERQERKQKKERKKEKKDRGKKKDNLEKPEGDSVGVERLAKEKEPDRAAERLEEVFNDLETSRSSRLRDKDSRQLKDHSIEEKEMGAAEVKDKKNKKEKKERKKERRERREKRHEKREKHKEGKENDGEIPLRKGLHELETEGPDGNDAVRNQERPAPEPGSLEAKALEMKMQRKQARQMRREQRQLKREEHERLRREMAEADGWQDAIGQLIEAAQAQSRAYSAAKAEDAPVIDVDADPSVSREGAPPLRSLEQLVKELDELERLKKEAKKQKTKAKTGDGEATQTGETGEGAEGGQVDAEGNALPQPVPNDPLNPLNAAYDMRAYALLRKLRLDEEHQVSQIALDEPDWDHLGYLRRSPSPCRIRTKGTMWPTRKGAWRSRAGGVYLPPEADVERRGSPSLSPARWMYPEEFNRPLQKARRSPSYTRFEREEISSSSSDSSSSSSTIPRRRKRRKASSSRASRPSPTYQPDE